LMCVPGRMSAARSSGSVEGVVVTMSWYSGKV
jgi:hypothetical protein